MGSQRNLGLLLLELERPVEAAEQLRQAADQGDEAATATLQQLGGEADKKREEAMFRLKAMATQGDPRAVAMLEQLAISSA